jgi:hypothetical protein
MKKVMVLILIFALACLAQNATAVSPMPEELERSQTVCVIHTVSIPDREKGMLGEESTSTLVFEVSTSKRDVLEKVIKYIDNKLNEGKVFEFKIECKFTQQ